MCVSAVCHRRARPFIIRYRHTHSHMDIGCDERMQNGLQTKCSFTQRTFTLSAADDSRRVICSIFQGIPQFRTTVPLISRCNYFPLAMIEFKLTIESNKKRTPKTIRVGWRKKKNSEPMASSGDEHNCGSGTR